MSDRRSPDGRNPLRVHATAAILLAVFAITMPPLPGSATDAPEDGGWIPPVVLAYTDRGINPYHLAFREPSWTAHPSTYIPGYPTDATALHVSLDAETYEEAIARDQHIWDDIEAYKLYYVPGTRIVGMITAMDWNGPFPILDETGHGSRVIDAGSGRWNGMAPNTAIVSAVVSGGHLRPWVADQLWIDMVSNSNACLVPTNMGGLQVDLPTGSTLDWSWSPVHSSYKIHQQGRLSFNAAGNGYMGTNAWCDTMPPWNIIVGGVGNWREAQQTYDRHPMVDLPFEIATPPLGQYATHNSLNGTTSGAGTSIASPIAMGYAARLVELARERLDHEDGFAGGKYAAAGPRANIPATGPLADGELDAEDIRRVLYTSAANVRVTQTGAAGIPLVQPPEEVAYLYAGYGGIGRETFDTAVRILMGEEEPEPRPYHDYWHHQIKSTQWEYWDFLRCKAHYDPTEYGACTVGLGDHLDPGLPPLP